MKLSSVISNNDIPLHIYYTNKNPYNNNNDDNDINLQKKKRRENDGRPRKTFLPEQKPPWI